jgi:hypothetical protein
LLIGEKPVDKSVEKLGGKRDILGKLKISTGSTQTFNII